MNIQNTPSVIDTQTLRGIIILDTCTLFALSAELTPDLLFPLPVEQKAPSHLLDTIPFLAHNGYKIIVPEMVAYGAAQVIRGGASLQQYFNKDALAYRMGLTTFFQRAISMQELDIVPPHDKDTSPAAVFIRKIWSIHKSNLSKPSKRLQIVSAQTNNRKDFGNIAAREYLHFMPPTSLPIFYLTDDYDASIKAENTRTDLQVFSLSMYNFLSALYEQKALPRIGINNYPPESFKPTLAANARKNRESKQPLNNSEFYSNPEKRQLFADTLIGIVKNDEGAMNDPAISPNQAVHPSLDARRRFLGRYGNIGKKIPS